jgi:hypothetical protein
MKTFQAEAGFGSVIPLIRGHIFPGVRCVAVCAVGTQTEPIAVILAALPMTGLTGKGCAFENQIQMAFTAFNCPVFAYQREICAVMRLNCPLLNILSFILE